MAAITLMDIYQIARKAGLDDEGARAAQAIALTEGALSGQVGDSGQSFGPFQFYTGGQLPNFAAALGSSVDHAAQVAQTNPTMAAEWALTGYLGNAIKQGQAAGLAGSQLATYAQTNGQVSESPERAGQNYTQLFQGGNAMADDKGQIISEKIVWLDEQGNETSPPNEGGLFGWGATNPTKYTIRTYSSGQIWASTNDGPEEYIKTDAQLATQYRSQEPSARYFQGPSGEQVQFDPTTGQTKVIYPGQQGATARTTRWLVELHRDACPAVR